MQRLAVSSGHAYFPPVDNFASAICNFKWYCYGRTRKHLRRLVPSLAAFRPYRNSFESSSGATFPFRFHYDQIIPVILSYASFPYFLLFRLTNLITRLVTFFYECQNREEFHGCNKRGSCYNRSGLFPSFFFIFWLSKGLLRSVV